MCVEEKFSIESVYCTKRDEANKKTIIIHVTLGHKTVQSTEEMKKNCLSLNQNKEESDDSVWVEEEYFCVGRRKK